MPGFPLWLYHLAECFCHLGLAASVFLTIAITIERYQVRMMVMMVMMMMIATSVQRLPNHRNHYREISSEEMMVVLLCSIC